MEPNPHTIGQRYKHVLVACIVFSSGLILTSETPAKTVESSYWNPTGGNPGQRGRLRSGQTSPGYSSALEEIPAQFSLAMTAAIETEGFCGDGQLDAGEQCDDGNDMTGDGCSDSCQVEPGWKCTDPVAPWEIPDGGFEAGTPNPYWTEISANFDTLICNEVGERCGLGTGTGPASGEWWAWFGGIEEVPEESSLQQSIRIPAGVEELTFKLEASACDSPSDFLELRIANVRKWAIDGSSELCGLQGYTAQTVNIRDFADGQDHSLEFHARTFSNNRDVTNFFVDDIAIPGVPSKCVDLIHRDSFESK